MAGQTGVHGVCVGCVQWGVCSVSAVYLWVKTYDGRAMCEITSDRDELLKKGASLTLNTPSTRCTIKCSSLSWIVAGKGKVGRVEERGGEEKEGVRECVSEGVRE